MYTNIKQPKNAYFPNKAAAPRAGTGFTNIQRIMGANVGGRVAQAVGSGIQQAGQQAAQALGKTQQEFSQKLQEADIGKKSDEEVVKSAIQSASQGADVKGSDVEKFGQYLQGQYKGPMGLQDPAAQLKAQQAQQLGESLGSLGGRAALLQRFAAAPSRAYTLGQTKLDLGLMGQPAGMKALKQARQQSLGLGAQAETMAQTAQTQAKEAQARASAIKQLAESELAGKINPLEQSLTAAAAAATSGREKELGGLLEELKSGSISKQGLERLGLSDIQGFKGFYGIRPEDLSGYFSPVERASKAGVATEAQAAQMRALSQLAGKPVDEFAKGSTFGKYGETGFGGTQGDLVTKIKQNKADYEQKMAELQAQYNAVPAVTGAIPTVGIVSPDYYNAVAALKQQYGIMDKGLAEEYKKPLVGTVPSSSPTTPAPSLPLAPFLSNVF